MDYKEQVLNEADLALEAIRQNNTLELAEIKKKIYIAVPHIKEIDDEIKRIGLKAIADVKSGISSKIATKSIRQEIPTLHREKIKLLVDNGFKKNALDSICTCKKCRDKGIVDGKYCECRNELIRRITYKLSGLKNTEHFDMRKFDIKLYDDESVEKHGITPRKNATNILEHAICFKSGNMLYYGGTGLGKTFLSSCIANEWMKQGRLVCYLSAPAMFSMLEDEKFGRSGNPRSKQVISMIYDADLLIIDDLGTEFKTSFTDSTLFTIINSRNMSNRSTLINTNLNLNEIRTTYSDRISSRLFGDYELFRFLGSDIRIKNRNKKS